MVNSVNARLLGQGIQSSLYLIMQFPYPIQACPEVGSDGRSILHGRFTQPPLPPWLHVDLKQYVHLESSLHSHPISMWGSITPAFDLGTCAQRQFTLQEEHQLLAESSFVIVGYYMQDNSLHHRAWRVHIRLKPSPSPAENSQQLLLRT